MAYVAPHIGNLRKRAKALGMVITKATTDEDARMIGYHEYVLHTPGADWENMSLYALGGIRHKIEILEKNASR